MGAYCVATRTACYHYYYCYYNLRQGGCIFIGVSLLAGLGYAKTTQPIFFAKFGGNVACVPPKKPLDFDGSRYLGLGLVARFSVAVTRWSRSTQLLYIEPGYYRDE